MKIVGFLLIAVGVSLIVLFFYNMIQEGNRFASPIPEETGVKVIIITPSK